MTVAVDVENENAAGPHAREHFAGKLLRRHCCIKITAREAPVHDAKAALGKSKDAVVEVACRESEELRLSAREACKKRVVHLLERIAVRQPLHMIIVADGVVLYFDKVQGAKPLDLTCRRAGKALGDEKGNGQFFAFDKAEHGGIEMLGFFRGAGIKGQGNNLPCSRQTGYHPGLCLPCKEQAQAESR